MSNGKMSNGLLSVGHLSLSPIGNLDPVDEAARVKVHHRPYSFEDGSVVYPANAFTLVCEVIRYRLVQVRQNHKKRSD